MPVSAHIHLSGAAHPLSLSALSRDERSFTRETDLSTEQTGAQAPSRLPRPPRHQRWPQGAERAACARSQAAQRLTRWPRGEISPMERLKQRADFLAAAKGARAPAGAFVLQARER